MPESEDDAFLRMRDWVDTRLDRLSVEAASRAATLAERPGPAISLQEYLEKRIDALAAETAADREAIRLLFGERLDQMTRDGDARVVVLRQLYDQRINALDAEVHQRFDAQDHAVATALTAQKEAVSVALTAQKEAVSTAICAVQTSNLDHATAHRLEHEASGKAILMSETAMAERAALFAVSVDRRFVVAESAVKTAVDAVAVTSQLHAESHAREHAAAAVAVEKQEKKYDEKHYEANRVREQQNADRLDFVRRDNLDARLNAVIQMIEKAEEGLQNRVELEVKARVEAIHQEAETRRAALEPLNEWRSRSSGQMAVWIGLSSVFIVIAVFLANLLTG